jgi:hypothetical protein
MVQSTQSLRAQTGFPAGGAGLPVSQTQPTVRQWLTSPQWPFTQPNTANPPVQPPYHQLATGAQNPHWPFTPQTRQAKAATWSRTTNFYPMGMFPIQRARNAVTQP